jgi:hypothetical protein
MANLVTNKAFDYKARNIVVDGCRAMSKAEQDRLDAWLRWLSGVHGRYLAGRRRREQLRSEHLTLLKTARYASNRR